MRGPVPRPDPLRASEPDINMIVAGWLADLAFVQTTRQQTWGYKQAARAIRNLTEPVDSLIQSGSWVKRIARVGPSSTRVVTEVLETGESATVASAVAASGRSSDIARRRTLRQNFLSRARVRAILSQKPASRSAARAYRGDLQMHSTWSDGSQTLDDIINTGLDRGYAFAAVTDHAGGLPIANGLSPERFAAQRKVIDTLNRHQRGGFRLLFGVEANIRSDGSIDVEPADRPAFDIIVAAPHSRLRSSEPQTDRLIAAVREPGVDVLGHPRGRMYGSRAGIVADWRMVFHAARECDVAVEIDGDPDRQDLDWELARTALDEGCLFALDSDAHGPGDWEAAETALAHARLAGIPSDRIINCWPTERLVEWLHRARTNA